MPDFEAAREETIRYHDELYASTSLSDADGWLAKPHRLVFDALELMPDDRPVIAYDLGAGIGRHTVPLLEHLPDGSEVHAVDLLASAVEQLRDLTPTSGATTLHVQQADLADVDFAPDVDLFFAFSTIEHLPGPTAIRHLLDRMRAALAPGGVIALGIVADRFEIDADGDRRPALLESDLTGDDVDTLLAGVFADLETVQRSIRPAEVTEDPEGETYALASTLITWIGRHRV